MKNSALKFSVPSVGTVVDYILWKARSVIVAMMNSLLRPLGITVLRRNDLKWWIFWTESRHYVPCGRNDIDSMLKEMEKYYGGNV